MGLEHHFGTWLPSSPAAFCPSVPSQGCTHWHTPARTAPRAVHSLHTPEFTWTWLAFFHNYWNPPRQFLAKLGNCEHRKLSWQFHWSRLSADSQYKIEPYKYQHLNDFNAFVTTGKRGISPDKTQFCDLHAGITSIHTFCTQRLQLIHVPTGHTKEGHVFLQRWWLCSFPGSSYNALWMELQWFPQGSVTYFLQFTPRLQTLLSSFKQGVDKLHFIPSTTDNSRK